jgi:hypothetical protein
MSSSVAARIKEAKWIRDRNVHFPILRIIQKIQKKELSIVNDRILAYFISYLLVCTKRS